MNKKRSQYLFFITIGVLYILALFLQHQNLGGTRIDNFTNMSGLGNIMGMTLSFLILIQFLVMSRVRRLEKIFGYLSLIQFHKILGYSVLIFIFLHPLLFVIFYSNMLSLSGLESFQLLMSEKLNIRGGIAIVILIFAIIMTVRYIRRRLYYESRYLSHLTVYIALLFIGLHHFGRLDGTEYYFWLMLYGTVVLMVIYYRLLLPWIHYYQYDRKISSITPDTENTISLTISGKDLGKLNLQAGQFIKIRILKSGLWWQSHPFSLSELPTENTLRLTMRKIGKYTTALEHLPLETKILIDGPFGKFTSKKAKTNERLYIAGGIGITPMIGLIQESLQKNQNTILLYANQNSSVIPLQHDIKDLEQDGAIVHSFFSREQVEGAEYGRITLEKIKKLVPDYHKRDIYICGPSTMIYDLAQALKKSGFPKQQLHYEVFNY